MVAGSVGGGWKKRMTNVGGMVERTRDGGKKKKNREERKKRTMEKKEGR